MKFQPKNKEEWQMQQDFIRKHIDAGGSMVVDDDGNLVRFEYDNPIFQYYRHNHYRTVLLLDMLSMMADWFDEASEASMNAPRDKKIEARIYPEEKNKKDSQ